jgi:3-hydroxymyristoyl/3-hydroxydecanoyl-(acyl carrier protein) dehydratase
MLESQLKSFHVENEIFSENVGEELERLISVSKPYFALKNIKMARNGYLVADLPVEMNDHHEVPSISLSEAGRHVAILGTMALANENPRKEKHYYLATDAVFERVHSDPISDEGCKGIAKVVSINKKEGVVHGRMYSKSNRLTYVAELRYTIIHNRIFERLFGDRRTETESLFVGNPYALRTPIQIKEKTEKYHTAVIERVEKNDCAGHFDNYPALPVARISGAMFDLSGNHYNLLRNSDQRFCIRRVEMHAESFIFAGEKVHISTLHKPDSSGRGTLIESYAKIDEACRAVETKCWFY